MTTRARARTALFVLVVAVPACRRAEKGSASRAPEVDGASPAAVSSPAPTIEAPRSFAPPPQKPPTMPEAAIDDVVTLEGVYRPAEEDRRKEDDESACFDPIALAFPMRVLDKGKEVEAGGTRRVCVWHWEGQYAEDKKPRPPMLQRESRVKVRGRLSKAFRPQHPKAILLFDTVVVSAGPPSRPAPVDTLPEGQSFVRVRRVDAAARSLDLDLAYVYYGDEARAAAAAHHAPFSPVKDWFVADDSPRVRSVLVPPKVSPTRLTYENGGGWRHLPLEDLADAGAPESPRGFFVTMHDGALTEISEVNFR